MKENHLHLISLTSPPEAEGGKSKGGIEIGAITRAKCVSSAWADSTARLPALNTRRAARSLPCSTSTPLAADVVQQVGSTKAVGSNMAALHERGVLSLDACSCSGYCFQRLWP